MVARKTILNFIKKASRNNVQKRSRVLADAALEMDPVGAEWVRDFIASVGA
jgi:hypothetical protein